MALFVAVICAEVAIVLCYQPEPEPEPEPEPSPSP